MLSREDQLFLFRTARQSIEHGLASGKIRLPGIDTAGAPLRKHRSAFVTLKIRDRLRGCIGNTEAIEPLVINIARNAYNAAFRDPRFKPLTSPEYEEIQLSISILTAPEPLQFDSETALLNALQPGTDGLIIERGNCRGTFLPVVWESLTTPGEFLRHLKNKAGMAPDDPIERAWRYRSDSYDE